MSPPQRAEELVPPKAPIWLCSPTLGGSAELNGVTLGIHSHERRALGWMIFPSCHTCSKSRVCLLRSLRGVLGRCERGSLCQLLGTDLLYLSLSPRSKAPDNSRLFLERRSYSFPDSRLCPEPRLEGNEEVIGSTLAGETENLRDPQLARLPLKSSYSLEHSPFSFCFWAQESLWQASKILCDARD